MPSTRSIMQTKARIPRLLAISDRHCLGARSFESWLHRLRDAGVDGLQLREKDLPDRDLLDLAVRARTALGRDALVLINGRIDIALASGCDGVHLPANGVPVAAIRRSFGGRPIIGRSTHHPDEIETAAAEGADFVTFGPIYPTPSKLAFGTPPGLDGLRQAVARGLPVIALGGLMSEQVAAVAACGAAGIAGIRGFAGPDTLAPLAAACQQAWPTE